MLGLVVLAVAPGLALLLFFCRRAPKQPGSVIAVTFALGAAALVPAALVSTALERFTGWRPDTPNVLQALLGSLLIVGLVEEAAKFTVVRFYCWQRREFDEPYDGILYAVVAALGFATVENIYYVLAHGIGTGVARALVAVPGHAFNGVLMGFFLGLARFAATEHHSDLLTGLGLGLAVMAHGLYDFIVFTVESTPVLVLLLLVFAALTWLIVLAAVRHHRSRSPYRHPLLAAMSPARAAGRWSAADNADPTGSEPDASVVAVSAELAGTENPELAAPLARLPDDSRARD